MPTTEVRQAVEEFLRFFEDASPGKEADTRLRQLLDRLAYVMHDAPDLFDPREFPEPPVRDSRSLYTRASTLFPNLGNYNVAMDVANRIGESECGVGDAIDDLADISADLYEAKWRWQNTSHADAVFHLRLNHSSHWGLHLRNLQLYLAVLGD